MSAVEGSGREGGVEGHARAARVRPEPIRDPFGPRTRPPESGQPELVCGLGGERTLSLEAGIKPGPSLSEPSIDARYALTECTSDEPLVEERPFRECRHCGDEFLLDAQPDDDDRAFCSESCFLSYEGAL